MSLPEAVGTSSGSAARRPTIVILARGRGEVVEKVRGRRLFANGGRDLGVRWEREVREVREVMGGGRCKRKDIFGGLLREMKEGCM